MQVPTNEPDASGYSWEVSRSPEASSPINTAAAELILLHVAHDTRDLHLPFSSKPPYSDQDLRDSRCSHVATLDSDSDVLRPPPPLGVELTGYRT